MLLQNRERPCILIPEEFQRNNSQGGNCCEADGTWAVHNCQVGEKAGAKWIWSCYSTAWNVSADKSHQKSVFYLNTHLNISFTLRLRYSSKLMPFYCPKPAWDLAPGMNRKSRFSMETINFIKKWQLSEDEHCRHVVQGMLSTKRKKITLVCVCEREKVPMSPHSC